MKFGFIGKILRIDLGKNQIKVVEFKEDFYRKYLGGGAIGAYFLLKECSSDTDPLSPDNILTFAPGVTTGARVSGASRCCGTAISPLTGMVVDSQAGGSIGPMIKRAGYDAIVIKGKADTLSYILIEDDSISIVDAHNLTGKTVLEVHDTITEKHGKKDISVLQCGTAGEKFVRYANVMADLNDTMGRGGLGAVMGSKNLRALVVRGTKKIAFADESGLTSLNKGAAERLPGSGFPETLKKYGTAGVVKPQAEAGNLATHNYSRSFHEDYLNLDASTYSDDFHAGQTTCFGCVVACRKKVKSNDKYNVTERLGGPEFETLGLLGSNLDITDPVAVAKANELCNNYGLDTITMGSIAGYIFESAENGFIPSEKTDGKSLKFADPDSLFWLIEQIVKREGIGDIAADGFNKMIESFGKETVKFAIHVKGQGLAVHMPQVKPSLALMYATCPLGPDHMSSEHDWLITEGADLGNGLGIPGDDGVYSTGFAKVRMTVYSQYFFSAMDALSVCMFCWGPGSIFSYSDLLDLIKYTTGWEMTMWELMKAGERRVTMLRQINAGRGFSREDDILPERLFKPLPDGATKGRHVDAGKFEEMLDDFYILMGWEKDSGNPTEGKLKELGLEWTLKGEYE